MKHTSKPFYILSGALAGDTRTRQLEKCATLAALLKSYGFATAGVAGCYNGETEPAVLAVDPAPGADWTEAAVLRLARQFGQESVLHVDGTRYATLIYCATGERAGLGRWRAVPAATARRHAAYTERNGQHYIAA